MKKQLFHHQKNHLQTMRGIGINIVLATCMYIGIEYWATQNSELSELAYWFAFAYIRVLIILVLLGLYFYRTKKTFSITVDSQYFEVKEPLFEQYTWKVKVADIVKIDQKTDSQTDYSVVYVILSDGSKHQLTINHRYDMKSLYAALKQANPNIMLPDIGKFRVPGWQKK